MSTRIFSIANQKGGVGKTTTAVNLGHALARRGINTLLVDLDPQANATSALGLEQEKDLSLYPCFTEGHAAGDKIVTTSHKNLSIIPSEMDMAVVEIELAQTENYLAQLRQCLAPVCESNRYGAILIDCPPALGMLSMNSLAAADYLLVALQCEYLAMEGLSQILRVVEQVREANVNPDITVGGIIMTMFDVRTNLSRQVVDEVRRHFPDLVYQTVIPRSVRLSEAPSFGQSIFEYDADSSGAIAYSQLAKEVAKRFDLR